MVRGRDCCPRARCRSVCKPSPASSRRRHQPKKCRPQGQVWGARFGGRRGRESALPRMVRALRRSQTPRARRVGLGPPLQLHPELAGETCRPLPRRSQARHANRAARAARASPARAGPRRSQRGRQGPSLVPGRGRVGGGFQGTRARARAPHSPGLVSQSGPGRGLGTGTGRQGETRDAHFARRRLGAPLPAPHPPARRGVDCAHGFGGRVGGRG
mmetsp:Transcript_11070/g.25953  ORF Transcript_11070/g.25953 Transcript_11070/m.25953 type:complete len:215 (+) Transcript_11070:1300-1944(+)